MRQVHWISLRVLLPIMWLAIIAACGTASGVRSWLDERSAVTVTAQRKPFIFSREDFPAAVNLRDYAQLGAFEVNRSGERKLYLSLVLWSTMNRSAEQLAQTDAAFATMSIRANDQLIVLQRIAAFRDTPSLGSPAFDLPIAAAHESYYAVTAAQLQAIAEARTLSIGPAAQGEQPYRLWSDEGRGLAMFLAALH